MATIQIAGVDGPYDVTTATFGDDPAEAIVVTDANLLFGMAVDLVRLMRIPALVPPVVVVGVGYPTDDLDEILRRRTTDFTPTEVSGWPGSGGGAPFRTMLPRTRPAVRHVGGPRPCGPVTLFGHSLGGMFSVTDWMAEDRLFDLYVISSPSLWWDDHALLRRASPSRRPRRTSRSVSEETDAGRRREAAALPAGDPWKPPAMYLDMVDDLLRFVACLYTDR